VGTDDPNAESYHTPHVRVSPGDALTGVVSLISRSGAGCIYRCEFLGLGGTDFTTAPISPLVFAIHTLEAYEDDLQLRPPYDLRSASEYPASPRVSFRAITVAVDNGNPVGSWLPGRNIVSQFGEHTQITIDSFAGGEIDILFGA